MIQLETKAKRHRLSLVTPARFTLHALASKSRGHCLRLDSLVASGNARHLYNCPRVPDCLHLRVCYFLEAAQAMGSTTGLDHPTLLHQKSWQLLCSQSVQSLRVFLESRSSFPPFMQFQVGTKYSMPVDMWSAGRGTGIRQPRKCSLATNCLS